MKTAIVFGGVSYEHEISIVSAIVLKKVLTCEVNFIYIDKHHKFYEIDSKNMRADYFSDGEYKKASNISIDNGGFFQKGMFGSKKVEFDVAINLIHGADGEDGTLAGLFDFFDIKYIGPRLSGSVLSFDKLWTKSLARQMGVKALDFEVVSKKDRDISLAFPFIVKPLRLGSSLGVSVVKDKSELDYALDTAFELDEYALIEPFVENVKEYNLAGCKTKDGFCYSIVEEPQKEEVLDFEKKYLDFSRDKQVQEADISDEMKQSMKDTFAKIYDPIFCGALIRCDFFVIDNEIFLNEINPNPGSLANYLFEDFTKVIEDLSKNLPSKKNIPIEFGYIKSIKKAKG